MKVDGERTRGESERESERERERGRDRESEKETAIEGEHGRERESEKSISIRRKNYLSLSKAKKKYTFRKEIYCVSCDYTFKILIFTFFQI